MPDDDRELQQAKEEEEEDSYVWDSDTQLYFHHRLLLLFPNFTSFFFRLLGILKSDYICSLAFIEIAIDA